MKNVDLDKYQSAWKNEKSFHAENLSETDIRIFMKSASKMMRQFKWTLLFDIVLKSVLFLSFVILLFLFNNQPIALLNVSFFIFITAFGIVWQTKVYKRLLKISISNKQLKKILRSYINFYNGEYVKSLFVSALSSTLFFLSGSLFYLYFKYKQIPTFEFDDFIVLSIGIVLSYGVSAFAQIKQTNFQIKQLESCLIEIEENKLTASSIKTYRTKRLKNIVVVGIALILGVILFLYLFLI